MSDKDTMEESAEREKPTVLGRLKTQVRVEAAFLSAFFRKWILRFVFILLHIALILGGFYAVVWWTALGGTYSDVDKIPARYTGVVLGCVKKVGSDDNIFFKTRVDAAARLYHAGKVQFLLVSGDNSHNGYDEPTDLKAALIGKGVPAERIYCDYAGLRTLDSVVRAMKVFGQDDFTVISQNFQNQRALYIARRNGAPDAVAFDAEDAPGEWMVKMHLREVFARLMAVLDVEFLGTQPKHLGKHIAIGPKDPPVDAQPVPGAEKKQ